MAANSLGRLTLDLLVQTADFTGPLTKAERQAKDSSRNMASDFDIATFAGLCCTNLSVKGFSAI